MTHACVVTKVATWTNIDHIDLQDENPLTCLLLHRVQEELDELAEVEFLV